MVKIDEEVLVDLLKKGLEIETANTDIILKLFVAEEDRDRRKVIYELLRDSEYHKSILRKTLRILKGDMPTIIRDRNYVFEDMFTTQRMAILKNIKTVIGDFYRYLIEDINEANLEQSIDKDKLEKVRSNIKLLLQEKERQLEIIEELGVY